MVNQIPDKGICPEEHRDEGPLFPPDKCICPACPEHLGEEHRDEGPFFTPGEGCLSQVHGVGGAEGSLLRSRCSSNLSRHFPNA